MLLHSSESLHLCLVLNFLFALLHLTEFQRKKLLGSVLGDSDVRSFRM